MRSRTWPRVAALCVAFGAALPLPAQERAKEPSADLPEGAGKAIAVAACVQCHGVKMLASQRKDRAAWESTVYDMVGKGAQLLPEEIDPLVTYLAAHFGPEPSAKPKPAEPTAPESKSPRKAPRRLPS
jgi:mono/diheme cytochrome c family protein